MKSSVELFARRLNAEFPPYQCVAATSEFDIFSAGICLWHGESIGTGVSMVSLNSWCRRSMIEL